MSMYRLLIGAALLGSSIHVCAAAPLAEKFGSFSGLIVGAHMGGAYSKPNFLKGFGGQREFGGASIKQFDEKDRKLYTLSKGAGLSIGFGQELADGLYFGLEGGYWRFLWGAASAQDVIIIFNQPVTQPQTVPQITVASKETKFEVTDSAYLMARMGLRIDRFMPYVGLGWSNAHMKAVSEVTPLPGETESITLLDGRFNGPMSQMGLDFKISPHLIGGIALSYAYYGKVEGPRRSLTSGGAVADGDDVAQTKLKLDKGRAMISLKFLIPTA